MSTGHSWKWLAPRLSAQQVRSSARAAASSDDRPCLPTIESLGDRLMFAGDVGVPPNTLSGILIGLIKGEIKGELEGDVSILARQGGLLKLAGAQLKSVGGIKWEDFHKFAGDVIKFDDSVFKFVEDIISGKSPSPIKVHDDLNLNFVKISEFAKKLDEGIVGEQQVSADRLANLMSDAAHKLVASFGDGSVIKSSGDYKLYLKLADSFGDASNGVLKLHESLIAHRATNGDEQYLKIKLQDILVSSQKLTDPTLKTAITDGTSVITALAGGDKGGGVTPEFGGGVTTTDTDDILK